MNRGVVATIAFAVIGVGAMVAVVDPSRGGQNTMIGFGLLAIGIVVVAILASEGQGSVRGDTHQEVHLHMPAQPQYQPAQYAPPAPPQIIYVPQPAPHYPPQPQYAQPQQYALPPQYAPPGYQPVPHPQAYLPAPQTQHQADYRGAIDVVAEPVHYAPQQQRLARGAVPQLESPQSAGLIRRMARRMVG